MACSSRKKRGSRHKAKRAPKKGRKTRGKGKTYRELRGEYNRILRAYKNGRLTRRQARARLSRLLSELDFRKNPALVNSRPGTLAMFKQDILTALAKI